ncbi:MAG TPA: hypothetical protein VI565_12240, partial [Burkholderiales bacterium]|nr:hypothetical protein [Burkholderiales bacterium]
GGYGEPVVGDIVGRSLVCGPTGVLAKYAAERGEEIVRATVDLVYLAEFRKRHLAMGRRRPDVYRDALDAG